MRCHGACGPFEDRRLKSPNVGCSKCCRWPFRWPVPRILETNGGCPNPCRQSVPPIRADNPNPRQLWASPSGRPPIVGVPIRPSANGGCHHTACPPHPAARANGGCPHPADVPIRLKNPNRGCSNLLPVSLSAGASQNAGDEMWVSQSAPQPARNSHRVSRDFRTKPCHC